MLIGYMRVSKSDGSHTSDLQRDALIAAGVDPAQIGYDPIFIVSIILGMFLAAETNTPIRRLVVNDIGPHVSLVAHAPALPERALHQKQSQRIRSLTEPVFCTKLVRESLWKSKLKLEIESTEWWR